MLMDKTTGSPITGDGGLPKVATSEFVPEASDGTVDVEFTIATTELAGHDIVFFEKLADADESIIAVHEDIDDAGQALSFPETGKGYPKTGGISDIDSVAASVLAVALCSITGAAYAYIRSSKRQIASIEVAEEETLASADKD